MAASCSLGERLNSDLRVCGIYHGEERLLVVTWIGRGHRRIHVTGSESERNRYTLVMNAVYKVDNCKSGGRGLMLSVHKYAYNRAKEKS